MKYALSKEKLNLKNMRTKLPVTADDLNPNSQILKGPNFIKQVLNKALENKHIKLSKT